MSVKQESFFNYEGFVEKFKPKKTTDDCYTPDGVFEVIKNWVHEKYGIDTEKIVRPFYPGGDYQSYDYPDDCVVLDNPPFSILAEIINFYLEYNIQFFLFTPALTAFGTSMRHKKVCVIFGADITYENGANVITAFTTSLDKENSVVCAPELGRAITEVQRAQKPKQKKVELPRNLVTSASMNTMADRGIAFEIKKDECAFVRKVGSYRLFGGGLLITDKRACEKERVEKERVEKERVVVELDDNCKQILKQLEGAGDESTCI